MNKPNIFDTRSSSRCIKTRIMLIAKNKKRGARHLFGLGGARHLSTSVLFAEDEMN